MRLRLAILTTAASALIASSAAASAQPAPATAEAGSQAPADSNAAQSGAADKPEEQDPATSTSGINLLPLIQVTTPYQNPGRAPVGGYVRFFVCNSSQCGDPISGARTDRQYSNEHRDWLSRWLIGRSFSRILTLKLSLARPNISANATLAASTAQSNRSVGETWSSEVNGRRYLTPYLRVDPDTVVSIEVSMNAATQVQANITRAVLDVVTRAATFVQPTAQLVTSLNSERFRQTSEFVDQSVSTLFAQNLAEQATNQFGPGDWTGKPLVDISARFPMNRRLVRSQDYSNVGVWRVMATSARVSMFSDVDFYSDAAERDGAPCTGIAIGPDLQACRAFVGLTPQTVLGLPVGENLTLGQALLADQTISGELTRLVAATATDSNRQGSARRLCGLVAAKAEALGFNRYDAAAAVWAFAGEAQLELSKRTLVLHETDSCGAATLLRRVKLI